MMKTILKMLEKMRFSLLFVTVLISMYSCDKDDANGIVDNAHSSATTRASGDAVYDVLGYGYDITEEMYVGNLYSPTKTMPVIDIQRFLSENPNRFQKTNVSYDDQRIYAGSDYMSYKKDIIKKNNVTLGGSYTFKDAAEKSTFNVSVDNNSTSEYALSSKDSYASVDIVKYFKRYMIDSEPAKLSNYLSSTFMEDLSKMTAKAIIEKYGTHVLIDFTTGGMQKAIFKSTIIDETTSLEKETTVKYGLAANLKGFGLSLSGYSSNITKETLTTKNTQWYFHLKTYGGSTNGTSYSLTSDGGTAVSVNIDSWMKSINENNAELVSINWSVTYPIYEFISDSNKKAEIEQAYINYIKSKQVEMYEVLPLYRLYGHGNSFYTTSYEEAQIYRTKYGYDWDQDYSHYIQGYVYKKRYSDDMVPLYRLYGHKNSFYTTSYEEAQIYRTKYGYDWDQDYSPYIQGYLLKSNRDGMVPLYRLYGHKNSFYTTSYEEAQIYRTKYGYDWDQDYSPYIQGYLIPYKRN